MTRNYPTEQRSNLVAQFQAVLQRKQEEDDLSFDRSFNHVALEVLGYDLDVGTMSDGRGDFGIDYWLVEERAATLFQFKSHDFTEKLNPDLLADPKYLTDLPRIDAILADLNNVPPEANAKIKELIKGLRSAVDRYRLTADAAETPFEITVFFCCLAKGFTAQAQSEFEKHAGERKVKWGEQNIRLITIPMFLDDLIAERWRESNTDWRTASGQKNDRVEMAVCGEMITAPKSAVFFTKAYDLVQAFDTYGYQMFEPNVRCELKRSKVNEAIRESVKHSRGRKEFRHLNNGITLICASFGKVQRGGGVSIRVHQPGVINGLQTVKSMHDALDELNDQEKEHFRNECEILVRLHTRQAVHDYKELVKSTNNQNPMQPRNLRSNDPEQIYYESLFAGLNWFYERKEGAWKALTCH
jgi:hypothetical protein